MKVNTFIPQMEPSFDENEINHLVQYMAEGGWVTEFRKTQQFAEMVAEYTGAKYCSIVSNGTVSLTIAVLACGVGTGDEVIVPDYTMVATPNSVVLAGATPVFCDIDRSTLCLNMDLVKGLITSRTKAVMLVTINGRYPENIEEFVVFCKERGLYLIEDAAQSLGSFYGGKHLGTFGDIGSFSFSAPKIISTGQGGALVTENPDLFDKIKKIRDFGRVTAGNDNYLTLGWNFKFTDVQAVIGIEQMKKLPSRVTRKKEIYQRYCDHLKDCEYVDLIPTNLSNTSPWFIDLLVENRAEFIKYLKENNIGSREFYPALHSCPAYNLDGNYPVTKEMTEKGVWLPSSSKLTNEQINYICSKIMQSFE